MLYLVKKIKRIMTRHPHVTVVVLVLLLQGVSQYVRTSGLFTALHTSQMQPLPTRFFSVLSPVVDFPLGQIQEVSALLMSTGSMFVMYYAPWCSRSMAARAELERASRLLGQNVQFTAVNCWYSQGSCRQQNSFSSFPVLFFYHAGLEGWKYTGVLRAEYMVEFILDMLHPVEHVTTRENLVSVIANYDTSVIGYFDPNRLRSSTYDFYQFCIAALRCIEKDPLNVVRYVALTDAKLAAAIGINPTMSVVMIRALNHSLGFPTKLVGYNSTLFLHWTFIHRQPPLVRQMSPVGSKSLQLSTQLQRGSSVLLFTHSLTADNPSISLQRDAALIYFKCNTSNTTATQQQEQSSSSSPASQSSPAADILAAKRLSLRSTDCSSDSMFASKLYIRPSVVPVRRCCLCTERPVRRNGKLQRCELCMNYEFSHIRSARRSCHFDVITQRQFADNPCTVLSSSSSSFSSCYRPFSYNPTEYVTCVCTGDDSSSSPSPANEPPPVSTPLAFSKFVHVLIANMIHGTAPSRHCTRDSTINKARHAPRGSTTVGGCEGKKEEHIDGSGDEKKISGDRKCKTAAEDDNDAEGIDDKDHDSTTLFSRYEGAACRSNQTITFFAMDWADSYMFVPPSLRRIASQSSSKGSSRDSNASNGSTADEPLGSAEAGDTDQLMDRILLINLQDESQYVMSTRISVPNILRFVENYTLGSLPRFSRGASSPSPSSVSSPSSTASFSPPSDSPSDGGNEEARRGGSESPTTSAEESEERVHVLEVTTDTFNDIVLENKNDVLLLYYTGSCGFCTTMSHVYLNVAQYFSNVKQLVFARLDGSHNDLPVQFTVSSYPTVIFFPGHSKSNSVVYPMRAPRTVPELVRFVLSVCRHATIINTAFARCMQKCIETNLNAGARRLISLGVRISALNNTLTNIEALRIKLLVGKKEANIDGDGSEYDNLLHESVERTPQSQEPRDCHDSDAFCGSDDTRQFPREKLAVTEHRRATVKHALYVSRQQYNVARYMYHRLRRLSARLHANVTNYVQPESGRVKNVQRGIPSHVITALMRRHAEYLMSVERHQVRTFGELTTSR